jgi:hypothetical protein
MCVRRSVWTLVLWCRSIFFQLVGAEFPTFIVRLGERPESLAQDWRRVHVADDVGCGLFAQALSRTAASRCMASSTMA